MGKLSHLTMILLFISIVGFIYFTDAAVEQNPFITENAVLAKLYTPSSANLTLIPGAPMSTYRVGEDSLLAQSIPTEPPDNFIESAAQFIDRIFVLFAFIRVMLAFLFVPAALFSTALALPWELTLLLGVPISTLYVIAIIDLFGGGDQ